jgi:hypothetical protein
LAPLLAGCPGDLPANFPIAPAPGTGGGATGGAVGTGGGAGSGGGGPGTGGATSACGDPPAVFAASCGFSWCHSAGDLPDFVTSNPPLETRLINQPAIFGCTTMDLVNGGNPPTGVLFTRLAGTDCGDRMPLPLNPGDPFVPLGSDQLACITSWLTSKL